MNQNNFEFGIEFVDEHGNIITNWGWTRMPELDADGWFTFGNGAWVEVRRILRRPLSEETEVWVAPI
ncbi:hypothetical protein ACTXM3_08445 [Glutamicibacter arilaitensis]|uniref:hypothetical protein n=1 Tax=Glutamicibacter arilaitensis TaxID=256701 RepID=UPI003FD03090